MEKRELRAFVRERRRLYGKEELALWSEEIVGRLRCHHRVMAARTLLLYHPLPDEVDIRPLIAGLYSQDLSVLLPKVISDTEMTIHQYHGEKSLSLGASFGILEPDTARFTDYSHIDVMIIPGMAFDVEGHRLGRGRGYYDRFLSLMPDYIYKVGVCFPFQMFPVIPFDRHDVAMDEVVCAKSDEVAFS